MLADGELVLYVERGGKTLLAWPTTSRTPAAAAGLALAVRDGALGRSRSSAPTANRL